MVFYSNATAQLCVSDADCSINRCADRQYRYLDSEVCPLCRPHVCIFFRPLIPLPFARQVLLQAPPQQPARQLLAVLALQPLPQHLRAVPRRVSGWACLPQPAAVCRP